MLREKALTWVKFCSDTVGIKGADPSRVAIDAKKPVMTRHECNCSICVTSGYLHHVVPKNRFRLVSGQECLTAYEFNTGIAAHPFSSVRGIKSFYYPRAYPRGVGVNASCLDQATVKAMEVTRGFDAANWAANWAANREERLDHYEPPSCR